MRMPVDDKTGTTQRAHLENAARMGNPTAIAALKGPQYPVALEYLWEAFTTLDRMRGHGMNGPQPLSVSDIATANQLFDWEFKPHEVQALTALDLVFRNPGPMTVE